MKLPASTYCPPLPSTNPILPCTGMHTHTHAHAHNTHTDTHTHTRTDRQYTNTYMHIVIHSRFLVAVAAVVDGGGDGDDDGGEAVAAEVVVLPARDVALEHLHQQQVELHRLGT